MVKRIAKRLDEIASLARIELRKLDEPTVSKRRSPDGWTIRQVIGHLVDSASNNHHRFVLGQISPQPILLKYNQVEWVASQAYESSDWQRLVEFWWHYNQHLAQVIRHMPKDALSKSFVATNGDPATMQFLIDDYLDHLKHHLRKVADRLHVDWPFAA